MGPRLSTCVVGGWWGRQHSLRGALERGVAEFGGKALGEGVWAGFRPSTVEGVSKGVSECHM